MRSVERLLRDARADDRSIRLDCTADWLATHAADVSVCGVRVAAENDLAAGYVRHAIIPTDAQQLTAGDVELLGSFLAAEETPRGLCTEWGRLPLDAPAVRAVLSEAEGPGFRPHHGSVYRWGRFEGRLVDVLTAPPDSLTTTGFDPRIRQYSVTPGGRWVGMHIDNAVSEYGNGERFAHAQRVGAADRRLLCNIGPGVRHLVMALNLTALHVSEHVSPGDADNVPSLRQLWDFLGKEPSRAETTVCIRVRLEPGGYVVFPAGIAIHDGSTLGSSEESRAIVLIGTLPRRTPMDAELIAAD